MLNVHFHQKPFQTRTMCDHIDPDTNERSCRFGSSVEVNTVAQTGKVLVTRRYCLDHAQSLFLAMRLLETTRPGSLRVTLHIEHPYQNN